MLQRVYHPLSLRGYVISDLCYGLCAMVLVFFVHKLIQQRLEYKVDHAALTERETRI